ncbi:MAG: glycosyltransferase [Deltaproteobacteria bacterium]|nr:glycosyltransferase [Deltaproteobacteria bacterium]
MKILMLGWEYPPHMSGGLGTACHGLTTALSQLGVDVHFVIPHLLGKETASHMHIVGADLYANQKNIPDLLEATRTTHVATLDPASTESQLSEPLLSDIPFLKIKKIPAFLTPYLKPETYSQLISFYQAYFKQSQKDRPTYINEFLLKQMPFMPPVFLSLLQYENVNESPMQQYGNDLFAEVARFTKNVLNWAQGQSFDLIHAHDWMTFPAGLTLSKLTGKPLVIHVHSLEYDRSGKNSGNYQIQEIEKTATQSAQAVIAVSHYTRSIINQEHCVPLEKVQVVHNGVYSPQAMANYKKENNLQSKIVLFLGRVTFQKGPDYFIEAASRVIPIMPDVTFVIAGTGDMLPQLIMRVTEQGLEKNFVFTGFLKGEEVERMYSIADLYIMPSVSEPFGISTLEAVSHDVPVIISKQSGVSEVLNNALKVDFWDVDRLANLMIGILKYPEIRDDIVSMAKEEVRKLQWERAANKVLDIYKKTLEVPQAFASI